MSLLLYNRFNFHSWRFHPASLPRWRRLRQITASNAVLLQRNISHTHTHTHTVVVQVLNPAGPARGHKFRNPVSDQRGEDYVRRQETVYRCLFHGAGARYDARLQRFSSEESVYVSVVCARSFFRPAVGSFANPRRTVIRVRLLVSSSSSGNRCYGVHLGLSAFQGSEENAQRKCDLCIAVFQGNERGISRMVFFSLFFFKGFDIAAFSW